MQKPPLELPPIYITPDERELWGQSYRAAHEARLLIQTLQLLYEQSTSVQQALHILQAEEARIAAEQEIQRRAAEVARLEAEEAQRVATAAETARLEAEAQAHDEEQARTAGLVAAQAEAERETERARIQLKELNYTFPIWTHLTPTTSWFNVLKRS